MDAAVQGVRTDVDAVVQDMDAAVQGLKGDVDTAVQGVRTDMDAAVQGVRTDMDTTVQGVRKEMDELAEDVKGVLDENAAVAAKEAEALRKEVGEAMEVGRSGPTWKQDKLVKPVRRYTGCASCVLDWPATHFRARSC